MSKIPNGFEVIQVFEQFSPKYLAVEGDRDKIGLQIGTLNKPVKKMMVVLDLLEEVVDEAISSEVDLIIAHHPPIFRPLRAVQTDTPAGRIIEKCILHNIAVYAAHTNLDVAVGGVNDLLANALELTDIELLAPTYEERLKKLAVYVPKEAADEVRTALGTAGAGFIGEYSHCTFNTQGTGTFLPHEGTNPHIGVVGQLEKVDEIKIETVFPSSLQKKVVTAMLKAHPYEEVAYDIYPLENEGNVLGLGRVGYLQHEMTLQQFAEHVKDKLEVDGIRVVGSLADKVKKVAVLGGDGNKYVSHAKRAGADVYVTGDMYYHVAHDAMMMGLNIVDPGHNVEKVMKKGVATVLTERFKEKKFEVTVIVSELNTDPFKFL
ncbi:Nif3-like dinuclear metal center hexameric protein [Fredinandcohnia sp. QZ13]|uniref:Nif3-like dinuclear metal center hexameric protein n=1 Tax=Fredinandcohnia sp. QZ13 TaxID=3073144 RepID=UPI002853686B|nr:Nif3-like dinuclear metal center hexameric protein [Fredinandcohnia sp. QZ13]MDR4888967.1 Nif3-like dinuclear metal center hexameric protein [Fredinandcohnia sp. QZ13]